MKNHRLTLATVGLSLTIAAYAIGRWHAEAITNRHRQIAYAQGYVDGISQQRADDESVRRMTMETSP